MLQKPDKDKLPHQCPHCGSMNCSFYEDEWNKDIMGCLDCDSMWFEYDDSWESVFQKGRIIKEVKQYGKL